MEQRLQKLLAAAGVASRRHAEELIISGRVSVNGRIISELGSKADPDFDSIAVDGIVIDLKPRYVYILLNKPKGYTSTRSDPHARHLVTDLVNNCGSQVYPVGRLDVDTEGLLLLTNDGDFSFRITHPSHHVAKTYRATVRGIIRKQAIDQLSSGISIDGRDTAPAEVILKSVTAAHNTSVVDITIYEGRKRQVRRMFEAIGHPVVRLVRTHIANLSLDGLKTGEWRYLDKREIDDLLSSS